MGMYAETESRRKKKVIDIRGAIKAGGPCKFVMIDCVGARLLKLTTDGASVHVTGALVKRTAGIRSLLACKPRV